MCKKAMISKNYKELDEAIKQKLPPYLYNGGQGQQYIYSSQCFIFLDNYKLSLVQVQAQKESGVMTQGCH